MIKVLVIGQTPPPYGGQAMMIKKLVDAKFNKVTFRHIRLADSKTMSGMGNFAMDKVVYSLKVVVKAVHLLLKEKIDILYYPPAVNEIIPLLRDIFVLTLVRPFTKKIVFHFHAGGLSEYIESKNVIIKLLANFAYGYPSAAIQISSFCPADAEYVKAQKRLIIPNGIDDENIVGFSPCKTEGAVPTILFVGVLKTTKGIFVLLDALKTINQKQIPFAAQFMGEFDCYETEQSFQEKVHSYQLKDKIQLLGVLTGKEKYQAYAACDVFCFPTYFESETFGLVLLEAMMFEVPVVATRWRGVQEVVDDGKTGYLIPIKDSSACADRLQVFLENPELRKSMGSLGREKFLREYTSEKFLDRMENAFLEVMEKKSD